MKKSLPTWGAALALVWLTASCSYLDMQKDREKDEASSVGRFDFIKHNDGRLAAEPEAPVDEEVQPEDAPAAALPLREVSDATHTAEAPGADSLVAGRREVTFYDDLILLDADEELDVRIVFNSSPLVDVLPAFADVLGFNYEADSEVKGVVNLNFDSVMTRRELWAAFDQMLRLAGATAIAAGDQLRVIPMSKLPVQSELRTRGRGIATNELITRTLLHASVADVAEQLKGFISASGTITALADGNIIMVTDLSDNITKIGQLLDIIDQPGRSSWPRAVVSCRNVKPSVVATELSEILPVIGLAVEVGTGNEKSSPGAIQLTGVDRLQIVVATAATREAIDEIRQWISILDNSDPGNQERVYVYKVAHGKADQLAQILSVIFSTQGSSLVIDTDSGNERTSQLNSQTTRTQTSNQVNNLVGAATNTLGNTDLDRYSDIFAAPVRLFADGVYNRLVIRTTPRTYAMIKALLDRLDAVPAQVLLQVTVVEVSLDDSTQFGVEFGASGTNGNAMSILGTNYDSLHPTDSQGNPIKSDGLTFTIADKDDPNEKFAMIKAMAGRNNVKVISSPQLVVTSHTEAMITVGNRVPILTSDFSDISADGTSQRNYTYEDLGITLTVTPQVTSTNLISMEVKQEVSEPVANSITSATDTPVIQQRIVETAMTIANGRTMIIGGLIQEKTKDNLTSVPVLADIPIVGRLFGNTEQSVERVELLVMITGYIVNEQSPVEEMIRRYDSSVRTLSEFEDRLSRIDAEATDPVE